MGRHAHRRGRPGSPTAARAQTALAGALAVVFCCTVIGLVLLWPRGAAPQPEAGFRESQTMAAEAIPAEVTVASSAPGETPRARITAGPDEGLTVPLNNAGTPGAPELEEGERILLSRVAGPDGAASYQVLDMDRKFPLVAWLAAAAVAVVVAAAWRGLRALLGLGITLAVIGFFLVPALLRGGPAVELAVVAGAAILFPVMFLVHGVNWKSASALGGTLTALGVSAVLAHLAIGSAQVRGLGDDSNLLIQIYLPTVSVGGLMLAGFIIGTLGALNDATVAQASTVAELSQANPVARPAELFAGAMRVGRDHIASMVYTLVLAYIGAALPMTLLLSVAGRPLSQVLTSDVVATELLRSVVGALGLALAVPVTTLIAACTADARRLASAR